MLLRLLRPLRRQISVYKNFSGAEKVCINTSLAPEVVFKYFPGFSGAGEVSDKYIYIEVLLRRRRNLGSPLISNGKKCKYQHFTQNFSIDICSGLQSNSVV